MGKNREEEGKTKEKRFLKVSYIVDKKKPPLFWFTLCFSV